MICRVALDVDAPSSLLAMGDYGEIYKNIREVFCRGPFILVEKEENED